MRDILSGLGKNKRDQDGSGYFNQIRKDSDNDQINFFAKFGESD